jgi:hypothetical protein
MESRVVISGGHRYLGTKGNSQEHPMRFMLALVLLTGLAAVSRGFPEKIEPAVPVLKADAADPLAFKQLISASQKLGSRAPAPVNSLKGGLPYVRKVSKHPILAMAESRGWFFYATSVARDQTTGKPVYMISGFAVKRGGRQVISWSVW